MQTTTIKQPRVINVLLDEGTIDAIDRAWRTDPKMAMKSRNDYIRAAIAEKLERERTKI